MCHRFSADSTKAWMAPKNSVFFGLRQCVLKSANMGGKIKKAGIIPAKTTQNKPRNETRPRVFSIVLFRDRIVSNCPIALSGQGPLPLRNKHSIALEICQNIAVDDRFQRVRRQAFFENKKI